MSDLRGTDASKRQDQHRRTDGKFNLEENAKLDSSSSEDSSECSFSDKSDEVDKIKIEDTDQESKDGSKASDHVRHGSEHLTNRSNEVLNETSGTHNSEMSLDQSPANRRKKRVAPTRKPSKIISMQLVSSGSQILPDLKGMMPETETRDRAKSSSN